MQRQRNEGGKTGRRLRQAARREREWVVEVVEVVGSNNSSSLREWVGLRRWIVLTGW